MTTAQPTSERLFTMARNGYFTLYWTSIHGNTGWCRYDSREMALRMARMKESQKFVAKVELYAPSGEVIYK